MKNALLVFIKNAELGKVKTRLAATVGDEKALSIYQQLLSLTQKITLQTIDCQRYMYYSNFINDNDNFSENDFTKCVQSGDDLGARMSNAFAEAFEKHQKVVIIGSDCAELSSKIITQAFEALETTDFVVGPAEDGGYYLLGMNAFYPAVFDNIEWSTDSVLPSTLLNINNLGKNIAYVKTLSDLDNEEDWTRVKHLL
jgi:uncharacterized protein